MRFSWLKKRKPNLLVLGASGGVANAFLHHLAGYRDAFGELVLLDKSDAVLHDPYIDHDALRYQFVRVELSFPKRKKRYLDILRKHRIGVVLDLTDAGSLDLLETTDQAGASYLNTALNDDEKTVVELFSRVQDKKAEWRHAPHILCTGMNPGVVNMWVRHGIEKFGIPKEIVHFEFDTSKTVQNWHPLITWSIHEFLVEIVRDPSGVALGREKVRRLLPNALEHRQNLKKILSPIMKLEEYPDAFTVLHEENLSLAHKYDIPSTFLYAIHPKTTKELIRIFEQKGNVTKEDLELGNNTSDILEGSDSIGVMLEYPKKKVYYFNTVPNVAVVGTNATYTQVVIGIFAALFTILAKEVKPGIHFVEDLYNTSYRHFIFSNMRVQEFVFTKSGGKLRLQKYNPMLTTRDRSGTYIV